MKTLLTTFSVALLLLVSVSAAQAQRAGERILNKVEQMKSELQLDQDQATALDNYAAELKERMREIREYTDSQPERRKQAREAVQKFDEQMMGILQDDQVEGYNEMKKEWREQRRERRQHRHGHGDGHQHDHDHHHDGM